MSMDVICSECGKSVPGEFLGEELVAAAHLDPEGSDQGCPGSGLAPDESQASTVVESEDEVAASAVHKTRYRRAIIVDEYPMSELPGVKADPNQPTR